VRKLRPGLWHWEAPHPEWRPTEPWSENVSSYAIDDGERLLLFDPLAVPSELVELAAGRETAIVLTAPWHERDAQSLVERLDVPVYTPLPDSAQYLMDTYGITAEQPATAVPTSSGCSARRKARHARTRPATDSRSVPTCSPGTRRTTPCSGSRASVR
jgi:hypothetical protein